MGIVSFFLGSMLGRVAGPIAQDYFENETKMGRRIQERKKQNKIEDESRAVQNKLYISEVEHQKKLQEMKIQFEAKRQDAERQYIMLYTDANQKAFLRDCWPLRNPFDAPIALNTIFDRKCKAIGRMQIKDSHVAE